MQNGNLIAMYRIKKGLAQEEMATLLKVSYSTYKLYEANIRTMKLPELNFLSNYYHISLNSLLNISDNPKSLNDKKDIDYKYLKFSLRYIRRINRVYSKDLAREFKMSTSTITKYEKHPECVSTAYLYMFAKKFHISLDYICGKTLKKEVL